MALFGCIHLECVWWSVHVGEQTVVVGLSGVKEKRASK